MSDSLGILSETLELTSAPRAHWTQPREAGNFVSMQPPRREPTHLTLVFSSARAPDTARTEASPVLRSTHPDSRLQKALHLIESALERRWTVAALARQAGMSRAAFARRFADTLGTSPLRYLTERRMERAQKLLAESQLPLSAVAERVGYASEFAFNRAFKRYLQVPPGAYRRRLRASDNEAPRLAA